MVKYIKASKDYIGRVWQSEVDGTQYKIVDSDLFPGVESYRFRNIDDATDTWVGIRCGDAAEAYFLDMFPAVDKNGKAVDTDYIYDILPTDILDDENGNIVDVFFASPNDFSEYFDLHFNDSPSTVNSTTKIIGAEVETEYNLKDDINAVGDKFTYITEGFYQVSESTAKEIIAELNATLDGYIVELANILSESITASRRVGGKVITAGAKIKSENEGILEVPEGKNVNDLPIKHFKELIDKKGREPIIRALTNLEVWNKNDNKSLSSWAKKMKKSLEGYGEKE